MLNILWVAAPSLLTILGTVFLMVGGLLGKGLRPDSADHIRHLVGALEPLIRSQRNLFQTISEEANKSPMAVSLMPMSVVVANEAAAENAKKAHDAIYKALDTTKSATAAANVRLWIFAGSVVLFASAWISLAQANYSVQVPVVCETGAPEKPSRPEAKQAGHASIGATAPRRDK